MDIFSQKIVEFEKDIVDSCSATGLLQNEQTRSNYPDYKLTKNITSTKFFNDMQRNKKTAKIDIIVTSPSTRNCTNFL